MDFVTHDTSGPPAHANNMPQPSTEWLAHSPAFQPQWSYNSPVYSHYDSTNPTFTSPYTSLPTGPHLATHGPGPRVSNGMNHYHMPTGPWPPTSLPHQGNPSQSNAFGSISNPGGHQTHHTARSSVAPPVIAHSPHAFAQQTSSANRQLVSGAVNPQYSVTARSYHQSQSWTGLAPDAVTLSIQGRQVGQSVQPQLRNAQSHSRPSSQTHQRTASTPCKFL